MTGKRVSVPTLNFLKTVRFIPDVSAVSVEKQAQSEYRRLDEVFHGIDHDNEDVASDLKIPELPNKLVKKFKLRIWRKKIVVGILVATSAIMFITAFLFALYGAAANDNSHLRNTVAVRWSC